MKAPWGWSAVWAGLVSRAEDHKLCVKLTRKCAASPQRTAPCVTHDPAQLLSCQLLIQTHLQSRSDCDQSIVMVASTDQQDTNIHNPGCPSLMFLPHIGTVTAIPWVALNSGFYRSILGCPAAFCSTCLTEHRLLLDDQEQSSAIHLAQATTCCINTYQVSMQMNAWLHSKTLCDAFFLLKESSSFPLSSCS